MIFCIVCSSQLDKRKTIVSLRCGHMYHLDCIKRCKRHSQKCPRCSRKFSLSQAVKIHPFINTASLVQLKSDLTSLQNAVIQKDGEIEFYRSQMQDLQRESATNRINREAFKVQITQKDREIQSYRSQIQVLQVESANNRTNRENVITLENDNTCLKNALTQKDREIDSYRSQMQISIDNSKSQIQDLQMEFDMNLGYFSNKFENDLKSAKQELKLKGIALKTSQRQIALVRKRQLKFANDWKKSYLLSKILQAEYGKLEEYIINSKFQDPRAKRSVIRCFQQWEKVMKIYPNFPNLKVSPK